MYDKIKKTASPLYLAMNGCSDMLNVVKTKCYKVISDTFKGEDILFDVVRDMGDPDDDINRYWRDENASMADLLSWVCPTDERFITLIDFVINPPVVSGEKQAAIISNLKGLLLDCGYDLIETNKVNGKTRYKLVEYVAEKMLAESTDFTSFDELFPFGLPVSINKPNFTINSVKGRQKPGFVENDNVGILRGDVYPRFDIVDFINWCNPEERLGVYITPEFVVDDSRAVPWSIAYNLCTTPTEKLFFQDYLSEFVIPFRNWTSPSTFSLDHLVDIVPALVPQVWVRFESHSANERNRMGYKDERLPYRVDFVAFWNSRRFIIMIDGIEHYAKQGRGGWDADEETYAARLREDRLLRTEGWHVFRVGNWEVKDDVRRKKVLQELREFIGFEMPKVSSPVARPRAPMPAPVKKSPPPPIQVSRPAPNPVPVVQPPQASQRVQFFAGEKVYHPTFGFGVVVSSKLVDGDEEITVAFAGKGVKRLRQSIAQLIPEKDLPF